MGLADRGPEHAGAAGVLRERHAEAASSLVSSPGRSVLDRYASWVVHRIEPADILEASVLEKRHRLTFWDSLIVISAARAGAGVLATEDLQHGRSLAGITVVDPFAT